MAGYYEANRRNHSSIYLDLAIVSPRVPFFRNDDAELLAQPILATVITSPAPNAGAVIGNEPENRTKIGPALMRRTELVLRAAALHEVDSLVLGAWGCGVFRNEPAEVAGALAAWLGKGREYERHFAKIVFALLDPTHKGANYKAFSKAFGK